ncbi:SANT [Nesidiocoris tenuis]|uniref:SANT n=1 Tax=Nesidiocoris tenuis TaxID=355587 RepID=A0ABN7ADA1_9HEMI|nr:SANT [Nesidiocoris tenuis]
MLKVEVTYLLRRSSLQQIMFSRGKLKPRIKPRFGNRVPEKRCQDESPLQSTTETLAPQHGVAADNPEKLGSLEPSPKLQLEPSPTLQLENEAHQNSLAESLSQKSNEQPEIPADVTIDNDRVSSESPSPESTAVANCENPPPASGMQSSASGRLSSDESCSVSSEDVGKFVPRDLSDKTTGSANQSEATDKVSTTSVPKPRDAVKHKPEHRLMLLKKIAPKIRPTSAKVEPSPRGDNAESSQKLNALVGVTEEFKSPNGPSDVYEPMSSKDPDSAASVGDASVDGTAVGSPQNISSQEPTPDAREAEGTELATKDSGFKPEECKQTLNESDTQCQLTPASCSEQCTIESPQLTVEVTEQMKPSKRDAEPGAQFKHRRMMLKKIIPKARPPMSSLARVMEKKNKITRADKNDENQPVPDMVSIDLTDDQETNLKAPNVDVPANHDKKTLAPCDGQVTSKNIAKTIVDKRKMPNPAVPRNHYKPKCDVNDVRIVHALNALDYLRRHDHALGGNSILRMRIIGTRNQLDASSKPTMCASCNPQILQKCLHTIASFSADDLDAILTRAEERRKTPMAFLGLNGKPTFKPSLGRQRAPTLSASTYGKMSFEVKENLAKKYGSNTPEMSKLRMIDLIFYNPPDHSESESSNKSKPASNKSQPPNENKPNEAQSKVRKSAELDQIDQQKLNEENEKIPEEPASVTQPASDIPVPQVKIGDEGQIILAPESLMVKKPKAELSNLPVVQETDLPNPCMKKNIANRVMWDFEDTLKFYKALHSLGTDFSCMAPMFPGRTRNNLKAKFKREEKRNLALVDKVLASQGSELNLEDVEKDLAADKALRKICREVKYSIPEIGEPTLRSLYKKRTKRQQALSDRVEWLATMDEEYDQEPKQSTDSAGSPSPSVLMKKRKLDTKYGSTPSVSDQEDEQDSGYSGSTSTPSLSVKRRAQTDTVPSDKEGENKEEEMPRELRNSVKRKLSLPAAGEDGPSTSEHKKKVPKKQPKPKANKELDQKPKKRKPRKKRRPVSPVIHTLPVVISDDEEDQDETDLDESIGDVGPQSEDCIMIHTNYERDGLLCSRSIKFDVSNYGVLDVNETIEHKDATQDEAVLLAPSCEAGTSGSDGGGEAVDDELADHDENDAIVVLPDNDPEPIATPETEDTASEENNTVVIESDGGTQVLNVLKIDSNELLGFLNSTGGVVIGSNLEHEDTSEIP